MTVIPGDAKATRQGFLLLARRVLVPLLLCAAALFAVAAISPMDAGEGSTLHLAWLVCAVLVAAALVRGVFDQLRVWRIVALGAALVVLGGVSAGWILLWQVNSAAGVGLAMPLALAALGAVLLAGVLILVLAPVERYHQVAPGSRWYPLLAVPLIVVLLAAGAGWLVAPYNVELAEASAPVRTATELELDGRTSWQAEPGGSELNFYDTAGGLAVPDANGLRMLDPNTGQPRWSFHRHDLAGDGTLTVSSDGQVIVFVATHISQIPFGGTSRTLWIFDAQTGGSLAEIDASEIHASQIDVVDDLLITKPLTSQAVVSAHDFDGELRWELRPEESCNLGGFQSVDDALLAVRTCTVDPYDGPDRRELVHVDTANGHIQWAWEAPGALRVSPGGAERPDQLLVAAVEHLPRSGAGAVHAVRLDLATGNEVWSKTVALPAPEDVYVEQRHAVLWAGDTPVIARHVSSELELAAVDPETGKTAWRYSTAVLDHGSGLVLPGRFNIRYDVLDERAGGILTGLPDGRLAISRTGSDLRLLDADTGAESVVPLEGHWQTGNDRALLISSGGQLLLAEMRVGQGRETPQLTALR
ncbi:putative pyrroloquinoline-quinone binding quinoprotein [Tamaricihabitans halophyticus]|uniref:Putative pyrroloquinoline-quinone binding quinoprotein n=1 Tax=Tamaricihabitans halophyticus TaxID=1262583 RepID=A0A4R2RBP0_9PSEU|nr:PQQ-binding-like beta-propeller repeat protein [Tamaricihabitans halophyticus]TCP56835.1 putative pyrroloquinoline-quinone binding quinoprotein [Tamaricihabitans halophyticus]